MQIVWSVLFVKNKCVKLLSEPNPASLKSAEVLRLTDLKSDNALYASCFLLLLFALVNLNAAFNFVLFLKLSGPCRHWLLCVWKLGRNPVVVFKKSLMVCCVLQNTTSSGQGLSFVFAQ